MMMRNITTTRLLLARSATSRHSFRSPPDVVGHSYFSTTLTTSTSGTTTSTTTPTSPENNAWSKHTLNCGAALDKASETSHFTDLVNQSVSTLQGIGPKHTAWLQQVHLDTIQDLADFKFFRLAVSIQALASIEQERLPGAVMNLNKGLDKAFETATFQEILKAPVHCLQGISEEKAAEVWKPLGIATVQDMADCKYFHWASAIVTAAKFEQTAK